MNQKKKFKRDLLYSVANLKERGWTKACINKFLGTPDDFRDNPNYQKAAPMHFYLRSRVKEAEKLPEVIEYIKKSIPRQYAAKKRAEVNKQLKIERMANYPEYIRTWKPKIINISLEELCAMVSSVFWPLKSEPHEIVEGIIRALRYSHTDYLKKERSMNRDFNGFVMTEKLADDYAMTIIHAVDIVHASLAKKYKDQIFRIINQRAFL
jgi:hypothetical protein